MAIAFIIHMFSKELSDNEWLKFSNILLAFSGYNIQT